MDDIDIEVTDDESMEMAANIASRAIQEIQDYLGEPSNNKKAGKVRFPRGYIRTASYYRSKINCISNATLKKNLSYNLMYGDIMRWISNRTDLSGTAKDMLIKQGVVLYGSIVESILIHICEGVIGKKHKFKERTKRMESHGIIDKDLRDDLNWLWDKRNNQHVFLLTFSEYEHYTVKDWNKAVKILASLVEQIEKWKNKTP